MTNQIPQYQTCTTVPNMYHSAKHVPRYQTCTTIPNMFPCTIHIPLGPVRTIYQMSVHLHELHSDFCRYSARLCSLLNTWQNNLSHLVHCSLIYLPEVATMPEVHNSPCDTNIRHRQQFGQY